MDLSLLFTLLGVIAAWTPFLYEKLAPARIVGKLVSQYDNVGEFRGEPKSLYLFKLSVVSVNHTFNLKDVDIDIRFEKNGWTHNSSINLRQLFFTLENKQRRLNISESSFLNNTCILKKDEPVVGYLTTTSTLFENDKISEIRFLFKSFRGKTKILAFKATDIDSTKLLYDDTIWTIVDRQNHEQGLTGVA
ncbi:hypothetical protein QEG73_15170 [Chitinophagaceae bacterium 26-R-25]|nr:hypothetical protein [Chitinophagaceae bacterium 26-R-25]